MVRTSVISFSSLGREYSPTSLRYLLKMREVVVPQGGLLRELYRSQYIYFLAENLLHEISKLRISVVSCCH